MGSDGRGERRSWAKVAAVGSACALGSAAIATHVAACWTQRDWTFLVLGLVMWPLGALHGVGVWLRLA